MNDEIKLGLNIKKNTSDDQWHYVFVKKPPAYKFLALGGGGARGTCLPGALITLEKHGVLNQLEMISGSSAGALLATFIAFGLPAKEIKKQVNQINLLHLIADRGEKNLQNVLAEMIVNTLRTQLLQSLKLQGNNLSDEELLEKIPENHQKKIRAMFCKRGLLTFADLEYLRHHFNCGQKKLLLTGTNLTDAKIAYFSFDTTPEMSLVEANRISASLPFIFEDVQYQNKMYTDGGMIDNVPVLPLQILNNKHEASLFPETELSILGLKLEGTRKKDKAARDPDIMKSENSDILYGRVVPSNSFLSAICKKLFAKIDTYYEYYKTIRLIQKHYSQNIISLSTPGINIASFKKANKNKNTLQGFAALETEKFLDQHAEQLMYYQTTDIFELALKAGVQDFEAIEKELHAAIQRQTVPEQEMQKMRQALKIMTLRKNSEHDLQINFYQALNNLYSTQPGQNCPEKLEALNKQIKLFEDYQANILNEISANPNKKYKELLMNNMMAKIGILLDKISVAQTSNIFFDKHRFLHDAEILKDKITRMIYKEMGGIHFFAKKKQPLYVSCLRELSLALDEMSLLQVFNNISHYPLNKKHKKNLRSEIQSFLEKYSEQVSSLSQHAPVLR